MDLIDPAIRAEINSRLDAIERKHGIRILYAAEAGSPGAALDRDGSVVDGAVAGSAEDDAAFGRLDRTRTPSDSAESSTTPSPVFTNVMPEVIVCVTSPTVSRSA